MKVGPFSLQVVTQQHCNAHCPCDSALAQQLKQQLRSALVVAQWRGDTALTLPLFWRRSTASSVFRVGARGRAFTLSSPPPPPPSLISSLASVDAKHNGNGNLCGWDIKSLQCTNVGNFSTNDYNYTLQSLTYLSKQEGRQAVSSVLSPCWTTRYNTQNIECE